MNKLAKAIAGGMKMSYEIISAYDKQDEVRVLFKEYTDYLVENDKKFAEYLAIQNYDDELKDLTVKYGKPYGIKSGMCLTMTFTATTKISM